MEELLRKNKQQEIRCDMSWDRNSDRQYVVVLTVTEGCVVTAAVLVLGTLRIAVALVLIVVFFTASAFTRRGSS